MNVFRKNAITNKWQNGNNGNNEKHGINSSKSVNKIGSNPFSGQ